MSTCGEVVRPGALGHTCMLAGVLPRGGMSFLTPSTITSRSRLFRCSNTAVKLPNPGFVSCPGTNLIPSLGTWLSAGDCDILSDCNRAPWTPQWWRVKHTVDVCPDEQAAASWQTTSSPTSSIEQSTMPTFSVVMLCHAVHHVAHVCSDIHAALCFMLVMGKAYLYAPLLLSIDVCSWISMMRAQRKIWFRSCPSGICRFILGVQQRQSDVWCRCNTNNQRPPSQVEMGTHTWTPGQSSRSALIPF